MVMYFQDDFWEAASELPRKERDAAIAAMVAYHFGGEEPSIKGAPKAVFIAVRERIEMSKTRQNSGKQNGSKPASKREANPQANAKQNGSSLNRDRDRGRDLKPPLPPFDGEDDGFADFGRGCLDAFNAETGQAVAWLPEKAWLRLRHLPKIGRASCRERV